MSNNVFYTSTLIFRCPANVAQPLLLRSNYGYNARMLAFLKKTRQFRHPSSVLLWCDIASAWNSNDSCNIGYWSWASGNANLDYWPLNSASTEARRHQSNVNVLWGDGHAAAATKIRSPLPDEWSH